MGNKCCGRHKSATLNEHEGDTPEIVPVDEVPEENGKVEKPEEQNTGQPEQDDNDPTTKTDQPENKPADPERVGAEPIVAQQPQSTTEETPVSQVDGKPILDVSELHTSDDVITIRRTVVTEKVITEPKSTPVIIDTTKVKDSTPANTDTAQSMDSTPVTMQTTDSTPVTMQTTDKTPVTMQTTDSTPANADTTQSTDATPANADTAQTTDATKLLQESQQSQSESFSSSEAHFQEKSETRHVIKKTVTTERYIVDATSDSSTPNTITTTETITEKFTTDEEEVINKSDDKETE